MTNMFETNINELSNLIHIYLLNRSEKKQNMNILDWSDDLLDNEGYDIFIKSTAKDECDCILPINIMSFDKRMTDEEQELIHFDTVCHSNLVNKFFDMVILRKLTKHDNSVIDVISSAAKCLKDGGLLYFNLILTEHIEAIFKNAMKIGLYPIAITNIQVNNNVRPEFNGREDEESFKAIIDMHGYIQICFRKKECSQFLFTEISDENYFEIHDQCVHLLRLAGIWKIDQAISGNAYIDDENMNKWIVSSKVLDLTDIYNCILNIKGSFIFSNTIKINMSDYFEVDLPRHKNFSELDTNMYYYLSPSLIVHCMIDNIINDGNDQLPELIMRQINFNYLGNVYQLIDTSGNIFDDEKKWMINKENQFLKMGKVDYFEKNAIELNSLNNVYDADIDISATLLYNLIRIKPIRKISLNYLKKYFYTTEYNKAISNISNMNNVEKNSFKSRGDIILLGQDSESKYIGYYSLLEFCEHHCDSKGHIDNDFPTYSIDDIRNAYIYIDDFKSHKNIISDFILRNDNSIEKYKNTVSKRFANVAFVNNLKKFENKAKLLFDIEDLINILGTEKQLAVAEMNYSLLKENKTNEIKLIDFYIAIEKYLRLCLACSKNIENLETGCKSLKRIGLFTFGDLCYCYRHEKNKKILFKNDGEKLNMLLSNLIEIKDRRNIEVHTGKSVNIEEAEYLIEQIYMVLKLLNDLILFNDDSRYISQT